MNKYTFLMLLRSIKNSIGRYLAIFAIVALGIGFFTGINNAEPSMQKTLDDYFDRLDMYDFSLVSTLGFSDEDVNSFLDIDGITNARGVYKLDALMQLEETKAYQIISLSDLAKVDLIEGSMPIYENECVVDAANFDVSDIGKTIKVVDSIDGLSNLEYKIVGLVNSPRFISYERGSTTVGDGNLSGFVYVLKDAFDSEVYHEIVLSVDKDLLIFSNDYDNKIDSLKDEVDNLLTTRANLRFNDIKNEVLDEINEAQEKLNSAIDQYNMAINSGIPSSMLEDSKKEIDNASKEINDSREEVNNLEEPDTYTLTLEEMLVHLVLKMIFLLLVVLLMSFLYSLF